MIDKKEIIAVLAPLNYWGKDQDTGFNREDYLKTIEKFSKAKEDIIAITGVRRAGKTYLSKQFLKLLIKKGIAKEQTFYVNFEEPKIEPFLSLDLLDNIYEAYRTIINKEDFAYIVLDEIQNIPQWEKWARIMQEKKENIKLLITGSSSKLLSKELSTVLTGRILGINIFPLDFKEFLNFKGLELNKEYSLLTQKKKILRLLNEYINYGGFPKVALEKDDAVKSQMLKEIFEGIIYRDIISRYRIINTVVARNAAEITLNNFSSLISANNLRNILMGLSKKKISPNFIVNLLDHLEKTFLICQIPIFSYKIKEQKLYQKKVYCIDNGLINAIAFRFSRDIGKLYENTVAIELLKRYGKEKLFYWKSGKHEEVDFLIKEGLKIKRMIQVCYNIEERDIKKREIKALLKASKELKCKDLLVITEEKEGEEKIERNKIKYIPLWKWLLE